MRKIDLMYSHLHYGIDRCLSPQWAEGALIASSPRPRAVPIPDPADAVARAVLDPVAFPPLTQATIPGDRVAIVLEPGLPRASALLAGIVRVLMQVGEGPEAVTVLSGDEDPHLLDELLPDERSRVERVEHSAEADGKMAYLAATRAGEPVYLHRALCDADVVIPVGLMRLENSLGYTGSHGSWYPYYSCLNTRRRYQTPSPVSESVTPTGFRDETDEVAWLLGLQFSIQVIPGDGNELLSVWAGDAEMIREAGRQECRRAWSLRVPRRAACVVATIEGGPSQQTWSHVARALYAADKAVEDDGTIVLCTELRRPPGPALMRLAGTDSDEAILYALAHDDTEDAWAACLLCRIRSRARVALLSDLESDVVENLGMGHLAGPEELLRFLRRQESCVVLSNAHRGMPDLAESHSGSAHPADDLSCDVGSSP